MQEKSQQSITALPLSLKTRWQKPALKFLIKDRLGFDGLQFCFQFPCQPEGEILYQLLYLQLIIENMPLVRS